MKVNLWLVTVLAALLAQSATAGELRGNTLALEEPTFARELGFLDSLKDLDLINKVKEGAKDLIGKVEAIKPELAAQVKVQIGAGGSIKDLVDQLGLAASVSGNVQLADWIKVSLDAAASGKVLTPENIKKLLAALPAGTDIPAQFTVEGLADKLNAIKDKLDAAVAARIDKILNNPKLAELQAIADKLKQAKDAGAGKALLEKICAAIEQGKALTKAELEELKAKLPAGAEIPLLMRIDKLQTLVEGLDPAMREKINNILKNAGKPDIEALIKSLRDAVANGLPKNLQASLIIRVEAGEKIESELAVEVNKYVPSGGQLLPESMVAPVASDNSAAPDNSAAIVGGAVGAALVVGAAAFAVKKRMAAGTNQGNGSTTSNKDRQMMPHL